MVLEEKFEGENAFRCEECGFHFKKENLAEKCESFCDEEGVCNTELTEKSIERS